MRMRLQRRLDRIYTVNFLIFTILCNLKLVSFFLHSSISIKRLYEAQNTLTFVSSYYMRVKSALQSDPLWVTQHINHDIGYKHNLIDMETGEDPVDLTVLLIFQKAATFDHNLTH